MSQPVENKLALHVWPSSRNKNCILASDNDVFESELGKDGGLTADLTDSVKFNIYTCEISRVD